MNDLWIIGERFVEEIYNTFTGMKIEAQSSRMPIPYTFDNYNVSCHFASSTSLITDVLARYVNAVITALNETNKLPRVIIFIPDMDLIDFIDFNDAGTRFVFGEAINWIISQILRAIESKKDHLRIRVGPVTAGEPKIIWIKAISRFFASTDNLIQINKFNGMLEDHLADRANHFIMDVSQVMHDHNLYTVHNALNAYGKQ